jgi:hypothetical protein
MKRRGERESGVEEEKQKLMEAKSKRNEYPHGMGAIITSPKLGNSRATTRATLHSGRLALWEMHAYRTQSDYGWYCAFHNFFLSS